MGQTIRLGTRGSQLALAQSNSIAEKLQNHGHDVSIQILETRGDIAKGSLAQIGGDGLFTKELQRALLDDRIDLAVHSLKDLPTDPVSGLTLAAIPSREDARDAIALPSSRRIQSLDELPLHSKVGTGSVRRTAQLKRLRPDLVVEPIRGNVDTRLGKLDRLEFDAIVLASAGLNRLGLSNRISLPLATDDFLPAVGQGALGLEIRSNDSNTLAAVKVLNSKESQVSVFAERVMLNQLSAGCMAPVGATTKVVNGKLFLSARVFTSDGQQCIEATVFDATNSWESLGKTVAEKLLSCGAGEIIAAFR